MGERRGKDKVLRESDLADYIHSLYQVKLEMKLIRDKTHTLLNRIDETLSNLQQEADEMAIKKRNLIDEQD